MDQMLEQGTQFIVSYIPLLKFLCWINHKTLIDRLPPQEHSKVHAITISQSQFNFKSDISDSQGGLDHKTLACNSSRTFNNTRTNNFCKTFHPNT